MYVEQPCDPCRKAIAPSMPRKARHAPNGAHTLQALREAVFGIGASRDSDASCGTGAIMRSSFPWKLHRRPYHKGMNSPERRLWASFAFVAPISKPGTSRNDRFRERS